MSHLLLRTCLALGLLVTGARSAAADYQLFARSNLVAWCIVPFDAKKRGPEERAAMMERLGFERFAYDYRAEHIPTWDTEMEALKRHRIQLLAWWFPTSMNEEARKILSVLERHQAHAQLWVMGGGAATKSAEEQQARIEVEVKRLKEIADAAAKIGCTVALYNHGAWFGEPENQIAIIERLRGASVTNVGIVYNLHHGHAHLDRFPALLQKMKPHLMALNINGMVRDGETSGRKILPLAQGDLDLSLLKMIRDSGWRGPIGILNHTDEDAEARLRDNLDGLDWLVGQLEGKPVGPKPVPRSYHDPGDKKSASASKDYWAVEDRAAREALPIYITIPAAKPEELTPANGFPKRETFLTWTGSAPPPTCEVNDRQFVIPATDGGKLGTPASDAYVAFALP